MQKVHPGNPERLSARGIQQAWGQIEWALGQITTRQNGKELLDGDGHA